MYTLTVCSRREVVTKQLDGTYRVRSETLRPMHAQAQGLLGHFGHVEMVWHEGPAIKRLLGR
jgi:hypothetical protein